MEQHLDQRQDGRQERTTAEATVSFVLNIAIPHAYFVQHK